MKNLLLLWTKNVHFTFINEIYKWDDGAAMGSPLGLILTWIFMIELENTLIPKLRQHVQNWILYEDDTYLYVKNGPIEYVLLVFETFQRP